MILQLKPATFIFWVLHDLIGSRSAKATGLTVEHFYGVSVE